MIKQNLGGSFLAKPCFRSAQEVHLESRAQRRVVDLSAQQKGSMERTPDPAERAASGATPPVNDGAAHQTAKHFIVKLGVDSGAPSSDGERQLVLADRGSLAKVGRPSSHFGIAHSAPISNKSTPQWHVAVDSDVDNAYKGA